MVEWLRLCTRVTRNVTVTSSKHGQVGHTARHLRFMKARLLLVGCLTSKQRASASQRRIFSDSCACCHTETEVAD